jgi:tetratricopeptide (TPR) repeat protein
MKSAFRQLFNELRRREVFKTAGIYLASSWVLLQVADVALLPIGLPGWVMGVLVWLVILGFPLAVFFSWRYDVSLQGITRTPPTTELSEEQDLTISKADFGVLAVMALFIVLLAVFLSDTLKREAPVPTPKAALPAAAENSIAVLPFENLGGNPEEDYFGQGLAEDILHRLTSIEGLSVASRTASFNLDTSNLNFAEIGERLAVRNVLEGSVRRSGDQVRIVAQLIDTTSGYHRWSGSFDRQMRELFSVYGEISNALVSELQLTLAPETELIEPEPTVNMAAYDYYLQARSILRRATQGDHASRAQRFYANAVKIDPGFAEAWAGECRAWLEWHQLEPSPEKVTAAEKSCRQALDLDPDLAESHTSLGDLYRNTGTFEKAILEYNQALRIKPRLSIAWRGIGLSYDEMGREREAENALHKAVEFDPNDLINHHTLGKYFFSRGRYADATATFERMVNIPGANASAWNALGAARMQLSDWPGAAEAFRQVIAREPAPRAFQNIAINYFFEGLFEDSVAMYREAIELDGHPFYWINMADSLREIADRGEEAISAYRRGIELGEKLRAVNPRDIELLSNLAHCYARVGDDETAMRYISQVLRSVPDDTYAHYYASLVHLEAGRTDQAVKAIEKSVALNYPTGQLRADPQFRKLYSEPAFAELIGMDAPSNPVSQSTNSTYSTPDNGEGGKHDQK